MYEVSCNNQETSLEGCSIIPCVDSTDIGQPFIYCHGTYVCMCVCLYHQLIMTDHSYFCIAFVCIATSPVCETDCNPNGGHEECCSDDNLGKFLEVKNSSSTIRYIVCPSTKSEYCDMII